MDARLVHARLGSYFLLQRGYTLTVIMGDTDKDVIRKIRSERVILSSRNLSQSIKALSESESEAGAREYMKLYKATGSPPVGI